jgi:hypothetical protein
LVDIIIDVRNESIHIRELSIGRLELEIIAEWHEEMRRTIRRSTTTQDVNQLVRATRHTVSIDALRILLPIEAADEEREDTHTRRGQTRGEERAR